MRNLGSHNELERDLKKIDGKGYKHYRTLEGKEYVYGEYRLIFKRVQPDPFARPSVVEVRYPFSARAYPSIAFEDLIHRTLYKILRRRSKKRGEGKSGELSLPKPSNSILKRSSVRVFDRDVAVRVNVGLPSRRRRILADEALEMTRDLVRSVADAFKLVKENIEEHSRTYLTYYRIREKLTEMNLVAFIANGSILPRACHYCEEPLRGAVPFESPPSMKVEIETEFGVFEGMGIPSGVVTIIGPAFHGKTTLLEALSKSVWPHVSGDGRELVVVREDFAYIRSEDGRRVTCVDAKSFLKLPGSECFTTRDASGATSVASAFQEAVEANMKVIALDEDYVASNFLFFDPRMRDLYNLRTIVTLSEQLKSLREKGLSVLLIANASLQIIAQSDKVIYMENYLPHDVTEKARKLLSEVEVAETEYLRPKERVLDYRPPKKLKRRGFEITSSEWREPIDFHSNLHVVEEGQIEFVARLLSKRFKGRVTDIEIPHPWEECVSPNCSEVRAYELAFALNRSEGLRAFIESS